jgi:hypothetical protein
MAFIFSTSHLPETLVRRPDHLEDDEEEENDVMQPMPRAGGVRAFSHLPVRDNPAPSTAPLREDSPRGGIAPIPPRSATPSTSVPPISEAQDDTPPPEADSAPEDAPAPQDHADDRPWYMPRITAQDLPPQDHPEDAHAPAPKPWENTTRSSGFDDAPPADRSTSSSGFSPSPQDLRDTFHSPAPDSPTGQAPAQDNSTALLRGRIFEKRLPPGLRDQGPGQSRSLSDKAEYHDLVYRPRSSPEDERDQHENFFQYASGTSATRQAPSSPRAPQTFAQSARPAAQPVQKAGQNTFAAPPPSPKTPDQQSQANMARSVLKSVPEDQRLEQAKKMIDLKVQFTLLTQGIPGLQKMVANEAGFSKNIQTGLLDNYLNGAPKKQYKMSHQDVYDCNIGMNFARSAEFLKALKENTTGTSPKVWTFKANVPAIAGTSATLGNFTAQVDMKVTSHLEQDKNGNWVTKWKVSGAFTVNDTYDFDIVDKEAERAVNDMVNGVNQGLYQGRTQAGQLKTLLMSRVPGTGFAVTSDPITFTQSSDESTAQIITDVGTYPPKPTAPPPSR